MKNEIKADLAQRYQASDIKDVLNTTTFLDPWYKKLQFLSTADKEDIYDNAINWTNQYAAGFARNQPVNWV